MLQLQENQPRLCRDSFLFYFIVEQTGTDAEGRDNRPDEDVKVSGSHFLVALCDITTGTWLWPQQTVASFKAFLWTLYIRKYRWSIYFCFWFFSFSLLNQLGGCVWIFYTHWLKKRQTELIKFFAHIPPTPGANRGNLPVKKNDIYLCLIGCCQKCIMTLSGMFLDKAAILMWHLLFLCCIKCVCSLLTEKRSFVNNIPSQSSGLFAS